MAQVLTHALSPATLKAAALTCLLVQLALPERLPPGAAQLLASSPEPADRLTAALYRPELRELLSQDPHLLVRQAASQ